MIDLAASVVTFAFVSDPDRRGLKGPSGTEVFAIFTSPCLENKKAGRKPDLSAYLNSSRQYIRGREPETKLFSSGLQILGRAFSGSAIGHNFEAHLLTFVEAVHPRTLDGRNMDEHVLAAIIRLDKSETLA